MDKFYTQEDLSKWAEQMNAKPGDLLLVLAGVIQEYSTAVDIANECRYPLSLPINIIVP